MEGNKRTLPLVLDVLVQHNLIKGISRVLSGDMNLKDYTVSFECITVICTITYVHVASIQLLPLLSESDTSRLNTYMYAIN